MDILEKIVTKKKIYLENTKQKVSYKTLRSNVEHSFGNRKVISFYNALKDYEKISIIAEVKKASPSKGLIRPDLNHIAVAEAYLNSDVQAMSVLTETDFFLGRPEFISDIRKISNIPLLRKDFIIDEYQIYEAKLYGADAILLIMAALTDAEYKKFHALADSIGLDVLVETHNEEEVKRAVEYGSIIGVNNRNLQTFDEDITTCERLLPLIPAGKVKVAESAIRKHSDFEYLRGLKFDAALIGEAFMREKDIKKAVDNLRYGN